MTDVLARLQLALAGRYAIERELGRGGMATVYLAQDLKHHRAVAVKVLRAELAAALGPERFLREIEISARLHHPHILPLYDSGTAGPGDGRTEFLYYVMPLVEGESLRDRLAREKQLPLDDALQIAREVADALSYAHGHDVVHRDIKPENILLESGHAVVADFGIARAITAAGGEKLTETGIAIGTPAYMSPEQAGGGKELDGRSDLYSLGCVLYEMLAGQPPFTGPTVESVVHQHLTVEPHAITSLRPAVPAEVAAALSRALAKTPADRFNPVAQFSEALRPSPRAAEAFGSAGPAHRWGRAAAIGGAVAVVALGWLGMERIFGRSGAPPLGERPYTIVAEVEGNADPEVRQAVRGLVTSALDVSGVITTLPDDQIRQGLTLAGKPETTTITVATARELAVRGSVRTVVATGVDRIGGTFAVNVRVLDADSGSTLLGERGVANGEDDLIPTVDRVVRTVRSRLGERRSAMAANWPLEQAATPSFVAYQRWRRARELLSSGDYLAAVAANKDALALDSGFAAAWRGLSVGYSNVGFRDSALAAVNEALTRPERLTEEQRLSAEGLRALWLGDDTAALAALEEDHRVFGGNPGNLPNVLDNFGRDSEAVAILEEWERSSPFGLNPLQRSNLTVYLLPLGRYDEAGRRAESLSGDYGTRARLKVATWTADWAAADSLATKLLERTRNALWRGEALLARASVAASRGRVQDALGTLGDCTCQLQQLVLRLVSGVRVTAAELRTLAPDTTAEGQLLVALWAVAVGDTGTARRVLTRVRSLRPERRRRLDAEAVLVEAWLAAAAERPAEVVRLLRPLAERGLPAGPRITQLVQWSLAAAYERQAHPDSAAAQLERLAAWQGAWVADFNLRGLTHSFAHQRLVLLYSRLGRLDDARRHWQEFSNTFTDPDPEMRHLMDEARRAVREAERRGG